MFRIGIWLLFFAVFVANGFYQFGQIGPGDGGGFVSIDLRSGLELLARLGWPAVLLLGAIRWPD